MMIKSNYNQQNRAMIQRKLVFSAMSALFVFVFLSVAMFSCARKADLPNPFIGLWEGTVFSQNAEDDAMASLEFVSIDDDKQEAAALLIYPAGSVDTVKLSGTVMGMKIDLYSENYAMFGAISADSSLFIGQIIRALQKDTLSFTFRNPKIYHSVTEIDTEIDEETDDSPQVPQITAINRQPDRLNREVRAYTVTIVTVGNAENVEFSMDGNNWQRSAEFSNVACGRQSFYARNRRDRTLQDQRDMTFECFVDVPLPTVAQLNELLKQLADCDDDASDELRKFGRNLPVQGVADVSNIEQLIRNACVNGTTYTVQRVETDNNGNLAGIVIEQRHSALDAESTEGNTVIIRGIAGQARNDECCKI